ncbi:hypothetical protein [Nostoc sp. C117]|uniref:hypothetical protein n=1 Tax=Nostoc sp. C117 TaxID=3349875 RepID=UPI00370DA073
MAHTFKHTFHGKQYRVLLEVTDWRIFPRETQWKKGEEPQWSIDQKQKLSNDKVTISAYALPQTMPSSTAFKRVGNKNTCIFWKQSNSEQCQEVFTEAWGKVKEWTSVSDEDLHQKFKPYLS